jgi:hypothetical protein
MNKTRIKAGLPGAFLLLSSIVNLIAAERAYPVPAYGELFLVNDIVNLIAAIVLLAIIFLTKPRQGLLIGIDVAFVYMAVPLALVYGLKPAALNPAAAIIIAVYAIIDQLKIEEVIAAEKGGIRKEHLVYIGLSVLFCAIFAARAIGILAARDTPAISDSVTSIADLAVVAIWLVLTIISIANADKRVPSLAGIMTSGAALNLSLILYFVVDGITRKESPRIADLAIISAMSLVFLVPSYRLLKK